MAFGDLAEKGGEIGKGGGGLVEAGQSFFLGRAEAAFPEAGLGAGDGVPLLEELDGAAALLCQSLREGRVREVPAVGAGEGRFVELEGAPDLVVEIVSDRSQRKDRDRLPRLYAAAGVPELWTADARGQDLAFDVQVLTAEGYRHQEADPAGWLPSPLLGARCRLTRQKTELARWSYRLEVREQR